MNCIIAVDEGTTSTRAMLYDADNHKFLSSGSMKITQYYPSPAWVEQGANEIYVNTLACVIGRIEAAPSGAEIKAIGITNQRETVVCWHRKTGKPIAPAIVWQCRRTADYCEKLKDKADLIQSKTGLVVDPYFSASKMKWILDNIPCARKLLADGNLCFGTIDSYLIFRLTEGRSFVTDVTNASRTMLFNIHTLGWDDELLELFGIPRSALPEVKFSSDVFGCFKYEGREIPIAGVAGDQQAALFGQGCIKKGTGKITYGTGMFMLVNTGDVPVKSNCGMITTIACSCAKKATYAIEGSVFNAGSCVQWLRDELEFFKTSAESEELAKSVEDTGGVYFVPAFTGLGAPYWNSEARACFTGISRGTNKRHLTRAVLEAICYSAKDVADCMRADGNMEFTEIGVDGGASANDFLMSFQSNVLGVKLVRPEEKESTALGVALLAATAVGLICEADVKNLKKIEKVFLPSPDRETYDEKYRAYKLAVQKCL